MRRSRRSSAAVAWSASRRSSAASAASMPRRGRACDANVSQLSSNALENAPVRRLASNSTRKRQTDRAVQQHSPAGDNAVALAPPAYGIDFVDQQMAALESDRACGGKISGSQYGEDEIIGGRTWGEFFGDLGRPVGTGLGNLLGWAAAAVTGIDVTSNSLVGPTWSSNGNFDWGV